MYAITTLICLTHIVLLGEIKPSDFNSFFVL